MNNRKLFKISFSIALAGTLLLLLILEYQTIPLYNIEDITKDNLETKVKIQGTIILVKETPGLHILNIKDQTSTITTIAFKEKPVEFKRNSLVEVEGKIQEYKTELEIIADKITLLQ